MADSTRTARERAGAVAGPRASRGFWQRARWPLFVLGLTLVGALVPLWFNHRYYYVGDTESGAYGQWFAIGARMLDGHWWNVLNPTVWQAGAYLADGAWGFYSPILWALGLITHAAENILLTVIVLKIVILCTVALGAYLLARSFGIAKPWAALVGVTVPFGGLTSYQDISSWVTGAIAWSIFPWAWLGIRLVVHRAWNVFAAIVPIVLLLGIVYTHATLTLVALILCVGVETLASRRGPALVRFFVIGVVTALLIVVVHLPALLVYPSSSRGKGVTNDGSLVVTLNALAQAWQPFRRSAIGHTAGHPVTHPLSYMAWFLPLVALVDWQRCWRYLRRHLSLPLFTIVILFAIQAPSDIGPLRWPGRLLPYATLAVVLLTVFGLSRARVPKPGGVRIGAGILLILLAAWVSWSTVPTHTLRLVVETVALLAVTAGAGWIAVLHLRRRRMSRSLGVVLMAIVSIVVLVPQHALYPVPGGPVQQLSARLSVYQTMLDGSVGDVFVVGDERSGKGAVMATEAALGNSWYLTGKPVQNGYTTLQNAAYTKLLCVGVKGGTCPGALDTLFSVEPTTGKRWVDLLGISTLLLIKTSFTDDSWALPRAGFHVVHDRELTRMLVRDHPIPGAGGIVSTSAGTEVRTHAVSSQQVRFTVDRVGSDRTVVFSRLEWPGYAVSGGAHISSDPVGGMLLTVTLPADAAGRAFTLTYTPPGLTLIAVSGGLAALILVCWIVLQLLAVRRVPRLRWLQRADGGAKPAPHPEPLES